MFSNACGMTVPRYLKPRNRLVLLGSSLTFVMSHSMGVASGGLLGTTFLDSPFSPSEDPDELSDDEESESDLSVLSALAGGDTAHSASNAAIPIEWLKRAGLAETYRETGMGDLGGAIRPIKRA